MSRFLKNLDIFICKLNNKCLILHRIKTTLMFKKKKNKIYSLQYDLDAFVVRITNERVDVETRSKTWKQVFLKGTPEYLTFVYILAPHMMVDPAIRAEKRDAERDRENATTIAKTLFLASQTIMRDPSAVSGILDVCQKSLDKYAEARAEPRESEEIEELKDAVALAEVKVQTEQTAEAIEELEQAKAALEKARNTKTTKRQKKNGTKTNVAGSGGE